MNNLLSHDFEVKWLTLALAKPNRPREIHLRMKRLI